MIVDDIGSSTNHDNLLFIAQVLISFHVLLHLTELCFPDHLQLQDYSKVSLQSSVQWFPHAVSFWLPSHKADPIFEGSHLIIQQVHNSPDPYSYFMNYLRS